MMDDDDVGENGHGTSSSRRILKVRLPQEQVIKLHELRILQGKSIATLLEGILADYFRTIENSTPPAHHKESQKEPQASSP